MAPVRSHYWITAKAPEFNKPQPFVILPDANAYARTEVGGLLFGLCDRVCLNHDPRKLPSDFSQLCFGEDPEGCIILEDQGPALARFSLDLKPHRSPTMLRGQPPTLQTRSSYLVRSLMLKTFWLQPDVAGLESVLPAELAVLSPI